MHNFQLSAIEKADEGVKRIAHSCAGCSSVDRQSLLLSLVKIAIERSSLDGLV